MKLGLSDKRALVVASSSGLGEASARALAREGANVVLCARRQDLLEKLASEIESEYGVRALALQADITDATDIKQVVEATAAEFGGIDILVNNAGGPPPGKLFDLTDEHWYTAFDLLLMSVVRFCRGVIPHMIAVGGGAIVNITSAVVKQPAPALLLSNSVRLSVLGLAKTLATEYGPQGIRVNSVLPGAFATARQQELQQARAEREGVTIEEIRERSARGIPVRRVGNPGELGDFVAYLASERSGYITGAAFQLDGGTVRTVF